MTKRNPLDPRAQIAAALGARIVCKSCYPRFKARLEEGRETDPDHEPCNDAECGCHCQDRQREN